MDPVKCRCRCAFGRVARSRPSSPVGIRRVCQPPRPAPTRPGAPAATTEGGAPPRGPGGTTRPRHHEAARGARWVEPHTRTEHPRCHPFGSARSRTRLSSVVINALLTPRRQHRRPAAARRVLYPRPAPQHTRQERGTHSRSPVVHGVLGVKPQHAAGPSFGPNPTANPAGVEGNTPMSITPARRRPAHRAPVTTSPRLSFTSGLDRRGFLRVTGLTVAGTAAASLATTTSASAASARFAGDKPGRIYLGASTQQDLNGTLSRTGPLGLRRTYYKWSDVDREVKNIKADHAAQRMPWISFKPATTARGGWASIAAGKQRRRPAGPGPGVRGPRRPGHRHVQPRAAQRLDRHPGGVRQGHDPHLRRVQVRDRAEERRLHPDHRGLGVQPDQQAGRPAGLPHRAAARPDAHVRRRRLPEPLRAGLRRPARTDLRLPRQERPLADAGRRRRDRLLHRPQGPGPGAWWKTSWAFAVKSGRVPAISYFNSQHNNNSGNTWLLWETSAKLAAFKASLASASATKL